MHIVDSHFLVRRDGPVLATKKKMISEADFLKIILIILTIKYLEKN
jgi:hypothetical protein